MRAEQEKERVAAEAKEREMKKRREMAAEMRRIEIKNNLKKVGVNTDTTTVNFDDVAQTTKLMEKAEEEKASAEQAALKKKADSAKRVDYITRATRSVAPRG